jgi:mRNA interferase MazF
MEALKRGDVVTVALQGAHGKPRPAVIVQRTETLTHTMVVVCPVTSELRTTAPLVRVTVDPSPTNGLRAVSQVMIDRVVSAPADKLGAPIGRLSDDVMAEITRRLAFWLGIA